MFTNPLLLTVLYRGRWGMQICTNVLYIEIQSQLKKLRGDIFYSKVNKAYFEGTCEVVQSGLCIFFGLPIESFDLPNLEDCEVSAC
jgi:hypothetical protein